MSKLIQMKDADGNIFPEVVNRLKHLGGAISGVATTFSFTANKARIVITRHNATPGANSLWFVGGTGTCFKMAGGANITMTGTANSITVTSSGGTVQVYCVELEDI